MITNAQIKKIKTLQSVCGLSDDVYRDILRNKAGVNSCKELRSTRQIQAVTMYLAGIADRGGKKSSNSNVSRQWEQSEEGTYLLDKAKLVSQRPNRPSLKQFRYIFGLWFALGKEWRKTPELKMENTLNHFLVNGRAGSRLKVATWQWLTMDMANHLIDVLKARLA